VRAIPDDGPARLLFFVEQRLAQLGWTREDLATQGGPSPSTFYKLVRQAVRPTERTIVRLDRALGWEAGSSHAVMAGGAPSLSVSRAVATVSARIDAELACCQDSGVKKTAAELREFLMDVASRLGAFYTGPNGQPEEVGDARSTG
jgi:hypothetical protein